MSEIIPPPVGYVLQPKTSALAIWSLVLGILSFVLGIFCVGLIFTIPAIICGHMACSRIKRSNGQLAGKGLAIAGFATGYASLALILMIVPAIAIPNFVKARQTAQMNACINNLRQIDAAKNQWALENNKTNGTPVTEADITPYIKLNSNGDLPKCPAGGTYTIGVIGTVPTCSVSGHKLPE